MINADFNNDGNLDLASANFFNSGIDDVTVYLGDGDGEFQKKGDFDAFAGVTALASGFLNNDGCLDLVVADQGPPARFAVLLGNCDGTFDTPVQYDSNGSTGEDIALGDFDEDGDLDIALAQGNSNNVAIFENEGTNTGAFDLIFTVPTGGTGAQSLAVTDFNEDDDLDLAVSNAGSDNVTILLGTNGANFRPRPEPVVPVRNGPVNVIVADFDEDGNQDFATANNESDDVSVVLGNGDGTFGRARNFESGGEGPFALASADYNLDGNLDIAVANQFTRTGGGEGNNKGTVSVLRGNGRGAFSTPINFDVGDGPTSVSTGDFDRNRKPDLATANFGAGGSDNEDDTLSVLLNTTERSGGGGGNGGGNGGNGGGGNGGNGGGNGNNNGFLDDFFDNFTNDQYDDDDDDDNATDDQYEDDDDSSILDDDDEDAADGVTADADDDDGATATTPGTSATAADDQNTDPDTQSPVGDPLGDVVDEVNTGDPLPPTGGVLPWTGGLPVAALATPLGVAVLGVAFALLRFGTRRR